MKEITPMVEYLSTGANRHSAVADWHTNGTLAFGADVNIALWRPEPSKPRGISAILSGHTGTVKVVKFLPRREGDETSYLVSGGDDLKLKLWAISDDLSTFTCLQTVDSHSIALTCLAVLKTWSASGPIILASGGADYTIRIWKFESGLIHHLQTIDTSRDSRYFPLSLALTTLGDDPNTLILASAGTRKTIHIFAASTLGGEAPEFQAQATLSGHEDWIRSLDFTLETNQGAPGDLLLASASQDKYIRLWRLHQGTQLPELSAAAASDPLRNAYLPGKAPSNKAHRLQVRDKHFSITFEALLLGHEDWIYSVRWHLGPDGVSKLLSTSADNSLAIWEPDSVTGIWASTTRLGEISRDKGATTATGSIGGFWIGLWRADGKSMVCLGRTGSWRRWDYSEPDERWLPAIAVTGHTMAITGISWSKNGEYLLSTSSDQTTRLHAAWTAGGERHPTWHEMSRPQIHGYDLNCIDSLRDAEFVSGADEKLMRVFREPRAVAHLLNRLCDLGQTGVDEMPDAANIPVLGLSNKAVDAPDDALPEIPNSYGAGNDQGNNRGDASETVDTATAALRSALDIDRPPYEDALSKYTLWPETEKLYGHGYEISCLATSHDGTLVASAPLVAHSLTTTRVRFSPDDRHILSVGRDRQWAVFARDPADPVRYAPLQLNPKGHARMILDGAWAPVSEGAPSRSPLPGATRPPKRGWLRRARANWSFRWRRLSSKHPVTAVDFLRSRGKDGHYVLAVGNEAGQVSVYTLDPLNLTVVSEQHLDPSLCPSKSILQLAWQPTKGDAPPGHALAIASEDTCLRIYRFEEI
ncbi:unnamed protein product [Parascedosporium putredinis]|uniref:Elongator complex protein 2 n=1 Tax=Parascedosporium putredinis TaxID=1442378 RepID=A0A9P1GUA8_9PEZI|nr:unnamed protein product [Parascedosporium putredinis]CAI7987456.1 unnamed protein product [Parascedosporium putredinis]